MSEKSLDRSVVEKELITEDSLETSYKRIEYYFKFKLKLP